MFDVIRTFRVTGKVQGVAFRHATRLEAERLNVRGYARNLSDGSVLVVASGSGDAVQELRSWLQSGPAHARVVAVEETAAATGEALPLGFETR